MFNYDYFERRFLMTINRTPQIARTDTPMSTIHKTVLLISPVEGVVRDPLDPPDPPEPPDPVVVGCVVLCVHFAYSVMSFVIGVLKSNAVVQA